jgi:hypothetical protein
MVLVTCTYPVRPYSGRPAQAAPHILGRSPACVLARLAHLLLNRASVWRDWGSPVQGRPTSDDGFLKLPAPPPPRLPPSHA